MQTSTEQKIDAICHAPVTETQALREALGNLIYWASVNSCELPDSAMTEELTEAIHTAQNVLHR